MGTETALHTAKGKTIAIAAVAALAAVAGGAYMMATAEAVVVPNVVGLPVDAAAASLERYGISIDGEGIDAVVVEQSPVGGELWRWYQRFSLTYGGEGGSHTLTGHGSP